MSKYIDYDAIDYRNDRLHDKSEEFLNGVIYMTQRIEEVPSIDIVFCKDCVWYKNFDGCFFSSSECKPEHFCSWGERINRNDLGDCNICRFAGCSECDDCINGSQWVRMTKEDEV